jgi:hypothetical protein
MSATSADSVRGDTRQVEIGRKAATAYTGHLRHCGVARYGRPDRAGKEARPYSQIAPTPAVLFEAARIGRALHAGRTSILASGF